MRLIVCLSNPLPVTGELQDIKAPRGAAAGSREFIRQALYKHACTKQAFTLQNLHQNECLLPTSKQQLFLKNSIAALISNANLWLLQCTRQPVPSFESNGRLHRLHSVLETSHTRSNPEPLCQDCPWKLHPSGF